MKWHDRAVMLILVACGTVWAGEMPLNPSFEQGDQTPTGWKLDGNGEWRTSGRTSQRSVAVTGSGDDSSYWRTTQVRFKPDSLYRLSFWVSAEGGDGCVVSGPSFCNRDFRPKPGWQRKSFVFVSPGPDAVKNAGLRLGQWHMAGRAAFDDVSLTPAHAIHSRQGDIVLGEGEEIDGMSYRFTAPLRGEGSNYSRPLSSFRCGFNSNRWTFSNGAEAVYCHRIPGARQTSARVSVNCNYHTSGAGFVEASVDGKTWHKAARFEGTGRVEVDLPADIFPAERVWVRLRSAKGDAAGSFQINEYIYDAKLDADLGMMIGTTAFPEVMIDTDRLRVKPLSLPSPRGESRGCRLAVSNPGETEVDATFEATVTNQKGKTRKWMKRQRIPARSKRSTVVPCELRSTGENTMTLSATVNDKAVWRAKVRRRVPALYDATYGYALAGTKACKLWWCEGCYKVSRTRPLPAKESGGVHISLARNEYEAAQLVLRPSRDLRNLRVRIEGRNGPTGLTPSDFRVDRVTYLRVRRPTDFSGVRGWWPDPLPPLKKGVDIESGRNHPLWITANVPTEREAGDYFGSILLEADGWSASVPLKLTVWNFTLPKETHLQTGFGLSTGRIRQYHNLETTEELRRVLELYFENFARHRISPYDPAPLDPIRVDFSTGPWEGGTFDDAEAKSGKMSLKVVDDSDGAVAGAKPSELIPFDPDQRYRFAWWVKTGRTGQKLLLSVNQHDAEKQWMPNNNIDITVKGTKEWRRGEVLLPAEGLVDVNPKTRYVAISLRSTMWSADGEGKGTAWFDDVFFGRADSDENLLDCAGFEDAGEALSTRVDFTGFDREAKKHIDGLGFNSFRLRLRGMGGGSFHARSPGKIGGFAAGTPGYEKLMTEQGRQIVGHLREKGWLDEAYTYWFDEPAPKDYEFVDAGNELIGRIAPGLTRMLTEQPEPALCGNVDLWCPVVSKITPDVIAERRKHGERFWWYLCCGPKAPYIGLFIDHPAVDLRVWAWLSRKWDVSGQLVWSTNYWNSTAAFPPPEIQNPWADPMGYVSGYSYEAGQIGYWGNGDGRFIYPPNRDIQNDRGKYLDGPINSIRWEMLRDGIEDYEYFHLLDELIARAKQQGKAADVLVRATKLARVPDEVIEDDKTYSKDPQPLYSHRRRVARMIEKLRDIVE